MFEKQKEKFDQLLWKTKLNKLNRFQAFLIRALRIGYGVIRDTSGGLPSLRAAGLVYTTLLSLVPLLAVSFSVLKGFGVHNQLEPALISLLEPLGEKGLQISQQIITFVDNIQVGVLGSIGLLVLVFTVLSLVKKIETAFNHTWRLSITRGIVQRISNYLSVILLGPLLLFTAAGIAASFHSSTVINKISSIEPFGTILLLIGTLLPFLLTVISFTFIYILIPNTRVKIGSAFYGAVAATILWKISGSVFATFIVNSTNHTAIYSGFAIMIIFMIWIYANWLIVLTGASIAYYHQNPDRISDKSQVIRLSCRLREKLALTVMQLIADNFQNNKAAWTIRTLSKKIKVSEPALTLILSSLTKDNLLTTTGEKGEQFLPNHPLENITLDMILNAVRSAEECTSLRPDDVLTVAKVDDVLLALDKAVTATSKDISLKDLV